MEEQLLGRSTCSAQWNETMSCAGDFCDTNSDVRWACGRTLASEMAFRCLAPDPAMGRAELNRSLRGL
jgi:hypothetical protein